MSQENVVISFVGQKISNLCWCTKRDGSTSQDEFLTGGYDDEVNSLCLWKIPDEAMDISTEPFVVAQKEVPIGSVTGLKQTSSSTVFYTTNTGSLTLLDFDIHNNSFEDRHCWNKLHRYDVTDELASCCTFDVSGQEIITGGEDGRMNILHIDRKDPIYTMDVMDSSNVTGIQYITSKEFLSINSTGQLKIWDTRKLAKDNKPSKTLTLSGNACPLLSVDKHPNQPHIVVTGHGDGVIGIWDTRQEKAPVTLIDAHSAEVWQVKFHPMYPDNLFTCSEDGSCWFWDGSSMISGANQVKTLSETGLGGGLSFHRQNMMDAASSSIWLYVDANKQKMETFSLVPFNQSAVNTFDVNASRLICGTDNEAIICVNDIPLH